MSGFIWGDKLASCYFQLIGKKGLWYPFMHTLTHTYKQALTQVHTLTRIHTLTRTRSHIHIYALTQAHMLSLSLTHTHVFICAAGSSPLKHSQIRPSLEKSVFHKCKTLFWNRVLAQKANFRIWGIGAVRPWDLVPGVTCHFRLRWHVEGACWPTCPVTPVLGRSSAWMCSPFGVRRPSQSDWLSGPWFPHSWGLASLSWSHLSPFVATKSTFTLSLYFYLK